MSNTAVPARHSDIEEFASAQAEATKILQNQFVVASGANVDRASAGSLPVGIADSDQVDGRVAVYLGMDSIKVPGESGHTLAVNDDVYLASATTVQGEPEAGVGDKAIGKVVEILEGGSAVVFRPFWAHMERGPDGA